MDFHRASDNGIDGRAFTACEASLLNGDALAEQLHTHNDVNDILHAAFLKWGEDFPKHLDGTFAAAVFDLDHNRLLLTRDTFGTIPLYYAVTPAGIAFSSHLDDFLTRREVEPATDRIAVWLYLSVGAVPLPRTILHGVKAVRPAETVAISLTDFQETRSAWWSLKDIPAPTDGLAPAEAARRVRDTVTDAVLKQTRNLANYRLLLSGGLDSAILLAVLSDGERRVPTLTLGYSPQHATFDETPQARTLAQHFNADAAFTTMDDWDVAKLFPRFIKAMDSPSRDGLNMFLAAKNAHDLGASAILTGLGGDELFAGYAYILRHLKAERLSRRLALLRPLMRCLPDRFRHNLMLPFLTRSERLETIRCQAYDTAKRQFTCEALRQPPPEESWLDHCTAWNDDALDSIRQLMLFDICLDMDHTLLRDTFAHSRANRLMACAPLAYRDIAALAWTIPSSLKIQNGLGKALLRSAFANRLPRQCLQFPKRGFEMPLLRWLAGPLKTRAQDAFSSDTARLVFNRQACLNWTERLNTLQPRDYPLWARFVLIEWLITRRITHIK